MYIDVLPVRRCPAAGRPVPRYSALPSHCLAGITVAVKVTQSILTSHDDWLCCILYAWRVAYTAESSEVFLSK